MQSCQSANICYGGKSRRNCSSMACFDEARRRSAGQMQSAGAAGNAETGTAQQAGAATSTDQNLSDPCGVGGAESMTSSSTALTETPSGVEPVQVSLLFVVIAFPVVALSQYMACWISFSVLFRVSLFGTGGCCCARPG